jgi:8-oxo-dGTP pyrophosphatase MutT (NUDIX family)
LSHADSELEKISQILKTYANEGEAEAAVALLLRVVGQRAEALFVRRVTSLTDPWSGQIALPGGRREVTDENLRQTVVRETFEETGIDLLHGCHFLGAMKIQNSAMKPKIRVLPFVVLLESDQTITLSKKELEWFVWIPLDELASHRTTVDFGFGSFPAYVVSQSVIWGLTYRIVETLLHAL